MAIGTGFGVHHHNDYYWNPPNLIQFCEDLKRHGVSAYTLWANDLHQVDLCKALSDHGIEVVYRPGLARIPSRIYPEILTPYQRAGAKYCQWYNEPNLFDEWKEGHKPDPETFAELWAPACYQLKDMGFIPVVPPLSPGGNIWHPDFFERMVQWWKDHLDVDDLLSGCVLGIHNRPTSNPPDATGVCTFNGYRYFRRTLKTMLGYSLDMVAPEAGYQPEDIPRVGSGYNWEGWKDYNLTLIRRFRPDHPDYVGDDFLFQCFWILIGSSTWLHCGLIDNWYYEHETGQPRTETNLWQALAAEDWGTVPQPPEPEPPPIEPTPEEPMEIDFDGLTEEMISYLVVSSAPQADQPHWKVTGIEVQPDTNSLNAFAIYPEGEQVSAIFFWADGEYVSKPQADAARPIGARSWSADMPMFNPWGTYGVKLEGNSESIFGFGLYDSDLSIGRTAHRPVLVRFAWVSGEEPVEPPPEPPEPPLPPVEPEPDILYRLVARLEQAPHGFQDLRAQVEMISDMSRVTAESLAAHRIDANGNPLFGNLRQIVLHHLGGTYYGALNMVAWAINDDPDIDHATSPYHFLIEKSGKILFLVAVKYLTYHAGGRHNTYSIGICFEDDATEEQMEAGRFLIASLYEFFGATGWGSFRLTSLVPHSDFSYVKNGQIWHTSCPGAVWPKILWSGDWPDLRGHL